MADNRMNVVSGIELAGGPGQGPVVTPQSTALMSDMFRKGAITVQDIVQGIDRHEAAKVQQKGAQMALSEASDPAAVAARQAEMQLRGATAQGALALQPLQQQATEVGLKGMVWASKLRAFGIAPESVVQLVQEGFTPPMDFSREPNEQDAALIRTMLQQSADFHAGKARQKDLEKQMSSPDQFRSPDGQTVLSTPTFQGKPVSQSEFSQTMSDFGGHVRAGDWVKAGARKPSLIFPGQAGAVSATPTVVPVAPPAPAPVGTGTVLAPAGPTVAQATSPATAAAPTVRSKDSTVAPQPTVTFGENGMMVHFPPPSRPKDPTEAQQKSASALTRMVQGEQVLDRLATKGFDPSGFMAWMQGLLPNWAGQLKGEEVRSYQQAADNWVQGLLRLESGAAIAYKEQKWYVNTFFPQVGDTPPVMAQKRQARQAMADFLHANVGRLTSPEVQAEYEAERNRLGSTADYSAQGGLPIVAPGQPRPGGAAPPAAGVLPLKSGRKIKVVGRDANGLPLVEYVK